jgi:hypothetical protein
MATTEYEIERQRAEGRREQKRIKDRDEMITRKARSTLLSVGWGANRARLLLAIQENVLVKADDVDKVYMRALELQAAETESAQKRTEELMAKPGLPLPTETIQKIRDYVTERRRTDPKCKALNVRDEVQLKFGKFIHDQNWYITYWGRKTDPKLHAEKPTKAEEPKRGRRTRTVLEFEGEHVELTPPAAEAAHVEQEEDLEIRAAADHVESVPPDELEEEAGDADEEALALYQIIPRADNRARVILDVEVDLLEGHALMGAIGGVLGRRHMKAS